MDPVCHRCRQSLELAANFVQNVTLYYHTANEEKLHMFPIGLNFADIDSETSSRTSTNWENFRGDVEDRNKSGVLTIPLMFVILHFLTGRVTRHVTSV